MCTLVITATHQFICIEPCSFSLLNCQARNIVWRNHCNFGCRWMLAHSVFINIHFFTINRMGRHVGGLSSCCRCGLSGADYRGWMDLSTVCGSNSCLATMLKLLSFGLASKFGIIYLHEQVLPQNELHEKQSCG